MGNWNSGRRSPTRTVEECLTISIAGLMKRGLVVDGKRGSGTLRWASNGGGREARVGFTYDLTDADDAEMRLTFSIATSAQERLDIFQLILLKYTRPKFGGRRWWMICPISGKRVAKLHKPPAEARFAAREHWGLGYRIQRVSHANRPLERLFKLQRKCGSPQRWGGGLQRPRGMWDATYERHLQRYSELNRQVDAAVIGLLDQWRN